VSTLESATDVIQIDTNRAYTNALLNADVMTFDVSAYWREGEPDEIIIGEYLVEVEYDQPICLGSGLYTHHYIQLLKDCGKEFEILAYRFATASNRGCFNEFVKKAYNLNSPDLSPKEIVNRAIELFGLRQVNQKHRAFYITSYLEACYYKKSGTHILQRSPKAYIRFSQSKTEPCIWLRTYLCGVKLLNIVIFNLCDSG
jgi:hypothetical protein